MSTVLWANVLVDDKVKSQQADHAALYRHAKKLDALTRSLALPPFESLCDTTDLRFNVENKELPAGMTSTDELMAVQGAWLPIAEAIRLLTALRDHVETTKPRFGLLGNQQSEVLRELDEALAFAIAEAAQASRFNFSIVM